MSAFLQVTLNYEMESINISSRPSKLNFAHSFDVHCLTNFAKNVNLSLMFFCFGVSYYVNFQLKP